MLNRKCTTCGSRQTESIEPDNVDYNNRHVGHWAHLQAMQGTPHPLIKAASVGVSVGRFLYKRFAGLKRCKSCGSTFR